MTLARRAAVLALLVPGALALWAAMGVLGPDSDDRSLSSADASLATSVAEPAEIARPRRERRRVGLASDANAATEAVPEDAMDAGEASGYPSEADRARRDAMVDGVVQSLLDRLDHLDRALDLIAMTDAAVRAVAVPDPATGVAREIARGDAAPMALQRYVERGAGYVDGAVELVGERRPALEEGTPVALSGRVLSADDRSPVVGAEVVVSSTFYVRATFYDHHLREVARAVTDHEGRWTIEHLNADPAHFGRGGKAYVTVTANGFAPVLGLPVADLSPGVANRLEDVTLDRASHVLRGRVLDMTGGAPVVGATVFATGAIDPVVYPKDQRDALFVGAPTAVTDDDGRFVLEGLGAGAQMISVHGGDDCIGRGSFRVPTASDVVLRTHAIRGRIEGEIVDARGEPVSLVMVDGGGNSTHSFADGRFVLENFRGDRVAMTFSHPDYVATRLPDVPDGAAELVVRMERRQPVVILDVRHADHEAPIAHVVVTFAFPEGVTPGAQTSPHHLSETGRHGVRLPDGAITMTISAEGFEPQTLEVVAGMDGDSVVVTLPPTTPVD